MADVKEKFEKLGASHTKFSENTVLLSSPLITVIVGQDQPKTFYVHEQLLARNSEFVAKAINGPFGESSEKTIRFPEEDSVLFGHFLFWLYQMVDPSECFLHGFRIKQLTDYVRLYSLGDRILSKDFKAFILLCLRKRWNQDSRGDKAWMTEPITTLIDMVELMVQILPATVDDKMQAYILSVFAGRYYGDSGWEHSAYLCSKLRQNPELEELLQAEPRRKMMNKRPNDIPFSYSEWPCPSCAHELS